MAMDQELAQLYGTQTQEDMNKVAEAQLFAKLAAQNNIDLSQYSDDQVLQLFNETMGKTAEEHCDGCDKPESECNCETAKEEAKVAAWQSDTGAEAIEKLRRAKAIRGYVPAALGGMALGGAAHLALRKKKEEGKTEEEAKVAAAYQEFQVKQEWQEKVAECDKLGRVMAHAYVQELGLIDRAKTASEGETEEEAAAVASEGKEASAIDQLAARHAVSLAHEAGLDVKVAAQRLDAVLTLGGPGLSEKTASVQSLEENVHIRALEYLEAAGYPISWS